VRQYENSDVGASLKAVPRTTVTPSTSDPQEDMGAYVAEDVMTQNSQYVLVSRETVTSDTATTLTNYETHDL